MFSVEFDLSLIFQWFEGILEGYFDDFSVMRMGKNGVKWAFCRTHYRTRKWGFRRENIRYALPGFRLPALKCKLRPLMIWKYTIIVQYYSVFYRVKLKCFTLAIVQIDIFVFGTQTLVFLPKIQNRSVVSVSRIHSKISKVVNNPKNNPHFYP